MTSLSIWEMSLRVLTAFLAGAIVGWEWKSHGRPAGLRTIAKTYSERLVRDTERHLRYVRFDDRSIEGRIEGAGLLIKSIRLSYELERQRKTVVCEVKLKRSDVSTRLLAELTKCDGIVRVRWI